MTTAEDICQGIPSERLDSPVTDIQIADLASELETWEELVPYLGLTRAEKKEIQVDYQGRYGLQKRQALQKWQSKLGRGPNGATYHNLIIALCRAKETEVAEKVRNLLTEPEESATSAADHVLVTFRKYLVDCYTIAKPPSKTQWPFSRLSSYIDLTLVQARDTRTPPSGQEERAQPLKEVQLAELFHVGSHQARRKVVLIEGPAGCGKTTLSWHVCREWAAGRLFQQVSLLIYVSLEDDTLLPAKCLADIIPHGSNELREAVARGIYKQGGRGVCFLFDAWDEAPPALHRRKSYLSKFIAGTSTRQLTHCSIVVTSRPAAASLLYSYLTAHVNIRGFGASKLEEFIHASLEDHDSRQKLLQQLREKPQVNDLCNLPINAAIVVHLFHHSSSTLPSTRTGLFKALVCNLLVRYMQLRTHHGLLEVKEFEHLPGDILRDLYSICGLAFQGIMGKRKVFLLDSLQKLGLKHPSSPLGLMQAQQQLTGFGARHCYSFLHYAVQEILAAYHISRLSEEEQAKSVGQILHSTPLSTVLPFYAGLTDTKSALKYLIEGVSRNTSLKLLVIEDWSLGPAHAYHLALLAAVCNTKQLDLSYNNIRSAIPFIAEAIKHNRTIEHLYLSCCYISDRELILLGEALQHNDKLRSLHIDCNLFTSSALSQFLNGLIGTYSGLWILNIDRPLTDVQRRTIGLINSIRLQQSLPPLQVFDMAFTHMTISEANDSIYSAPPDIRSRFAFRESTN